MTTRDMVFVALFAALTAALAVFPPFQPPFLQVPIIVQNIGVMLAGSILGARRGGLALLLFVVLVAIGMPILSGGRGGMPALIGVTGGFVLSWIPAAFVVGWLVERYWNRLNFWNLLLFNVVGGIFVVYLIGVPWWAVMADLPLWPTIQGSVTFMPGDLIKAIVVAAVAMVVKRSYPLINT